MIRRCPIAGSSPPRTGGRRPRRRLVIAAVVGVAVLVLVAPLVLRTVGRWLVVDDELGPADAIYVHAGHLPVRALEGADLYRQGLASEVWLAPTIETAESRALQTLGLEVPRDLSVMGFGHLPGSDLVDPPLTTMGYDRPAIGRETIAALLRMVERGERVGKVVVPAVFVERASCGPAPSS